MTKDEIKWKIKKKERGVKSIYLCVRETSHSFVILMEQFTKGMLHNFFLTIFYLFVTFFSNALEFSKLDRRINSNISLNVLREKEIFHIKKRERKNG